MLFNFVCMSSVSPRSLFLLDFPIWNDSEQFKNSCKLLLSTDEADCDCLGPKESPQYNMAVLKALAPRLWAPPHC